jgi:hypothetical protein
MSSLNVLCSLQPVLPIALALVGGRWDSSGSIHGQWLGSPIVSSSLEHQFYYRMWIDLLNIYILEIESNSRYRKYKESAHMTCLTNPSSQPSLDISPIWIPLICDDVSNSQGRLVWSDIFFLVCMRKIFVQILLHRWRQRQNIMVPQFSSIIASTGCHGVDLVARFCAKNVHLPVCISFSSVYALS